MYDFYDICRDQDGSKTAVITRTDPVTNNATVAFVSARALASYKYACDQSGVWWVDGFEYCSCANGDYWDGANGCMTKPGKTTVSIWNTEVPVSTIKSECNRLGGTYDEAKYLCNHPTKTFVVTRFDPSNYRPTFGFVDDDTLNNYKLMCFTSGRSWRRSAGVSYCHCMSESMFWDEQIGCGVQSYADWEEIECNSGGVFDSETRGCRCNSINKYGVVESAVLSSYRGCKTCSDRNAIYINGVGKYGACQECPDKVDVEHNKCVTSCGSGQKYIESEYKTIRLCVPASYSGNSVD